MKEINFINQNLTYWKAFEKVIENKEDRKLDEISDMYIKLTNDLSYAKTFYSDSTIVPYLNGLTLKTFQIIYKNKRNKKGRLKSFISTDVPLVCYKHRRKLFYAFAFFALSVLIGVISTLNDSEFTRLILGDEYVDMTMTNIDNQDPMAVYKEAHPMSMSLGIAINNIKVSFFIFISGVFLAIGTIYLLFYNGVMLGSFQTMFYKEGLFWESFNTIWIHGTLEISAIIIAGAAGLILGSSILFPSNYKRIDSFQKGMKDGLKLLFGLIPVFLMAAFLEGFVTRYTNMPNWLSLLIILASLAYILWYFVIYPYMLNRKINAGNLDKNED